MPELVAVEKAAKSVEVANPAEGLMLRVTLARVSDEAAKLRPITAIGELEALIVWRLSYQSGRNVNINGRSGKNLETETLRQRHRLRQPERQSDIFKKRDVCVHKKIKLITPRLIIFEN